MDTIIDDKLTNSMGIIITADDDANDEIDNYIRIEEDDDCIEDECKAKSTDNKNGQSKRTNSRKPTKKTSKYRGVCWLPRRQAWRARIERGGKRIHIGYFLSEIEAAKAYDQHSFSISGNHGRFNFPEDFGVNAVSVASSSDEIDSIDHDDSTTTSSSLSSISSSFSISNVPKRKRTNAKREDETDVNKRQRTKRRSSTLSMVSSTSSITSVIEEMKQMHNSISMDRSRDMTIDATSSTTNNITASSCSTSEPKQSTSPSVSSLPTTPLAQIQDHSFSFMTSIQLQGAQTPLSSVQKHQSSLLLSSSISPNAVKSNGEQPAFKFDVPKKLLFKDPTTSVNDSTVMILGSTTSMQTKSLSSLSKSVTSTNQLALNAIFEEIRKPSTALFNALLQRYQR